MVKIEVNGIDYGDGGKGKVVDYLAKEFHLGKNPKQTDVVARFQGGPNAGHTVHSDEIQNKEHELVLHGIPSGVLSGAYCILGAGMVLSPEGLKEEFDALRSARVSLDKIVISHLAHLILPNHIKTSQRDKGSTGRGVGPAYSDKYSRTGLRMIDLVRAVQGERIDPRDTRVESLRKNRKYLKKHKWLVPHIRNINQYIDQALSSGGHILAEGAQGMGLDTDLGQYPHVTSSSCGLNGLGSGLQMDPRSFIVLGVTKAYLTRVDADGLGPLVTQMDPERDDKIRNIGNEFGATTGRPRRCGWLDIPHIKNAMRVGVDALAIMKLDILDNLGELKLCVDYTINGTSVPFIPDGIELRKVQGVYETFPGWENTKDARTWNELPKQAQRFLSRIEELCNRPVAIVSVGKDREQTIVRRKHLDKLLQAA